MPASRPTSARPIVLSVKAKDRTPDEVAQVVELCLVEIAGQHAHTAAVVANRCEPAQMAAVAEALQEHHAEVLRAARGAAAGRARGRRPCSTPSTATLDQRRPGAARPRGDGRAGRGHDRRARAGTAHRRRRGHHPRRPLRRRARGGECPCGGGLSVAVVHHPQRRAASCTRRSPRWCPGWACGCRSSPPTLGTFETASSGRRDPRPGHRDRRSARSTPRSS